MNLLEQLARAGAPLLKSPAILRIRRNHSLEHATIYLLQERGYRLAGYSSVGGFVLLGDVPTAQVETAVAAALQRLKAGQKRLALHPNCGTNIASTSIGTALLAYVSFAGCGWRSGWQRLPTVIPLMTLWLLCAPMLGMSLQRHFTTCADMGDLQLHSVRQQRLQLPLLRRASTLHHVSTQQGLG